MSIPKTTPARIQIQEVSPQVDCGRYPVKRTVGDEVAVAARIFRDGHEALGAAVRHKGPDATRWSETPLEPLGNDVWAGSFEIDRPGLWSFRIEAWVDRVASLQEELRRKVAAGQADLTSELSEAAVLLGDDEADGRDGPRRAGRHALGESVVGDVLGGRRPRPRPLRLVVRALPALVGRLRRRPRAAAALRRARLRRPLPAADPPDRTHEPQGPEQHGEGEERGRRQPVGDRLRGRRARRDRPVARHREGAARAGGRRAESSGSRSRSTSRSSAPRTTRG